jgi:hypothetical protein
MKSLQTTLEYRCGASTDAAMAGVADESAAFLIALV